ncbi:MAG: hypothetical protein V2A54_10150 [Bacteroidota bacterium]
MQRVKYLRFLLLLIFMISCMCVGAQDTLAKHPGDSSVCFKPWKVSRTEFKTQFGKGNDSLNGLIDLYYNKRRNGFIKLAITPLTFYLFGFYTATVSHEYDPHYYFSEFLLIAEPFVWSGFSVRQISKFSRKKLYQLVVCDSSRNQIDSSIQRRANLTAEKKNFKLNKKEFIEKHSWSDSSQALINLFFRKRLTAKLFPASLIMASILTTIVTEIENRQYQNTPNDSMEESEGHWPILSIATGCLSFSIAIPVTITGIIRHLIYTRKKLYHLLLSYQQTGILKNKYRRKLTVEDFKRKKPNIK